MTEAQPNSDEDLILATVEIVTARVGHGEMSIAEIRDMIGGVYSALADLGKPAEVPAAELVPAVPIRSSVKHDYIVCLEDGKRLKMLKRYLRTNYDMTPEEYRTKWKLPRDYPMVAPAYAETRKQLAVKIGLGRKPTFISTNSIEAKRAKRT